MTDYKTEYGVVHYGGSCVDSYPNIEIYDQPNSGGIIKLQAPALRSFKAAEERIQAKRVRELHAPRSSKDFRPIACTGTWRSCAYQAQLYARDSHRYASPNGTGHTRGLCIDVSTAQGTKRLADIHRALMADGWHQARPDEKWHWSFHLSL